MILQSGCAVGPAFLQATRVQYNHAIQSTTNEQLLLNLVRLKYRDVPFFLEVSSVSVQFTADASLGGSATINENIGANPRNPDVYGITAGAKFSERPTISYAPLQGDDFVERLLTPLTIDTILLLARSGWSLDRVLRTTVQRLNGLDNACNASSPTPPMAPRYEQFAKMTGLLRQLQQQRAVQIDYEPRRVDLSEPIDVPAIDPSSVLAASEAGLNFRRLEDDQAYVLSTTKTEPVLIIAPAYKTSSQVAELMELLGLRPGESRYSLSAKSHQIDDQAQYLSLGMETRSLMGVLFYLSQAIEIPERHQQMGWVTRTLDANGEVFNWSKVTGDLLQIHSRSTPPSHASVAVRYRGHWFYIDQADLESKSTFALLSQLFALKAGGATSEGPVLTLPIGG